MRKILLPLGICAAALVAVWYLHGARGTSSAYSKAEVRLDATITGKAFEPPGSGGENSGHHVVYYKIDNRPVSAETQDRVRIDKQGDRFTWIDPPCFDALKTGDKLAVAYSTVNIYDVEFVTRHPECGAL